MSDQGDDERTESLDVIDLQSELGIPKRTARRWPSRPPLSRAWVAAIAVVCLAGLGVVLSVVAHGDRRRSPHRRAAASTAPASVARPTVSPSSSPRPTTPPTRPRGPILGSFYPDLDGTDTTTLVLPSGLNVTLSGGLRKAIGGLGADFGVIVDVKSAAACCAIATSIYHASPNELFDSLGPGPISTPVLVPPGHAKQADLKGYKVAFAVISTGDWTLTALFEDEHVDNAGLLERMRGWSLRSTPNGAVLEVPAGSTFDQEGVGLGRTPDLSAREIELTANVEPCHSTPNTARTITTEVSGAVGHWCAGGVDVEADGPLSYVKSVVAALEVAVEPNP